MRWAANGLAFGGWVLGDSVIHSGLFGRAQTNGSLGLRLCIGSSLTHYALLGWWPAAFCSHDRAHDREIDVLVASVADFGTDPAATVVSTESVPIWTTGSVSQARRMWRIFGGWWRQT